MAAQYRKALVAALGVSLLIAVSVFDVVVPAGLSDGLVALIDGVLGLLTAYGVLRVPNEPLERGR